MEATAGLLILGHFGTLCNCGQCITFLSEPWSAECSLSGDIPARGAGEAHQGDSIPWGLGWRESLYWAQRKSLQQAGQQRKVRDGVGKSVFRSDLSTVHNGCPGFSSESRSSQKLFHALPVLSRLCSAPLGLRELNQISAQHMQCILVVISALMHCHKMFIGGASCLLEGAVAVSIHLLGSTVSTGEHHLATDTRSQWTALVSPPPKLFLCRDGAVHFIRALFGLQSRAV